MRIFIFCLGFIFLAGISGCDKENYRRIKYRVVSKTSFDFVYTVNGNSFAETGEAGDWQSSYRVKVGTAYFLSAIKTSPGFELSILIYIDDELIGRVDTDEMWQLIKLEGTVF